MLDFEMDPQPAPRKMLPQAPSHQHKILIVAGSVPQAKRFARRHGIFPMYWKYITNEKDVLGEAGSVVYTGTYYQRIDIKEIEAAVQANESLKVVDMDE